MFTFSLFNFTRAVSYSLAVMALLSAPAQAFDWEDIEFWVGTGANRTAMVIDWNGDNLNQPDTMTLVWGYRWDGAPKAEQALRDILAADDRLYARLGNSGAFGVPLNGLGYDTNDDGEFQLEEPLEFDADGIAIGDLSDGVASLDSADTYREGWYASGFWNLSTTSTATSINWMATGGGISSLALVNDRWVGLAFTPAFNYSALPNQLMAASAPPLPGDFNRDGTVNLADYTVWRDTSVDPELYQLWKDNFGMSSAEIAVQSTSVPEPTTYVLILMLCLTFSLARKRYLVTK